MKRPKTVKSFLKCAMVMANTPIIDLAGIDKLTEKEQRIISELTVVMQNELSENSGIADVLHKFKLKY